MRILSESTDSFGIPTSNPEQTLVLSERIVSTKEIGQWATDFLALVTLVQSLKYSDIDEAVKDFPSIEERFKVYFRNLESYMKYSLRAITEIDPGAGKAFNELKRHTMDMLDYLDPATWMFQIKREQLSREEVNAKIDWYVNNRFLEFGGNPQGGDKKTLELADALWSKINDFLEKHSKTGEVDLPYTASKSREWMGFTIVNLVGSSDVRLDILTGESEHHLRRLKKILPDVFYGVISLEPIDQRVRTVGSLTIDKIGGEYHSRIDEVKIHFESADASPSSEAFAYILIHELAHRYWFKFMTESSRSLYSEWFESLRSDGPSAYSNANPEEDFAEAVAYYVYEKGYMKSRDARQRLEQVLHGKRLTPVESVGYEVDGFGIPITEKMLLKTWDEYAKKVSDAYQARPSMESQYLPSWKSLIAHIEKMYDQMQSRITVEFTPEDPYKIEKEIMQDIEKNKRLKIYSGHAEHPVWTVEQNLKFRAYHDYLSHVAGGHAFGSKGEIASYNQHAKMVPRDALLALFTEIIGQAMTATQTASFPEQKICKLHGFDYINLGKVDDQEYQRNFGG